MPLEIKQFIESATSSEAKNIDPIREWQDLKQEIDVALISPEIKLDSDYGNAQMNKLLEKCDELAKRLPYTPGLQGARRMEILKAMDLRRKQLYFRLKQSELTGLYTRKTPDLDQQSRFILSDSVNALHKPNATQDELANCFYKVQNCLREWQKGSRINKDNWIKKMEALSTNLRGKLENYSEPEKEEIFTVETDQSLWDTIKEKAESFKDVVFEKFEKGLDKIGNFFGNAFDKFLGLFQKKKSLHARSVSVGAEISSGRASQENEKMALLRAKSQERAAEEATA